MARFGEEYVSYGGRAIKYHASLRIHVDTKKRKIVYDAKKRPIGVTVDARVIKNKLAKPFGMTTYYMTFDQGICPFEDCKRSGVDIGCMELISRGRWVEVDGKKVSKKKWPDYVLSISGNNAHWYRTHLTQEAVTAGLLKGYGKNEDKSNRDKRRRRKS